MIDQLLDQLRGSTNNHHHTGLNPLMTAAATYLGNELSQNHHHRHHNDRTHGGNHEHTSHFWRNAAVTGALAYGLHKYKNQHHQQPSSHQPPQQVPEGYPAAYQPIYHQPSYYPRMSTFPSRHGMTIHPNNMCQRYPHYYSGITAPRSYRHSYYHYSPPYHPSTHMIPCHRPINYRSLY